MSTAQPSHLGVKLTFGETPIDQTRWLPPILRLKPR